MSEYLHKLFNSESFIPNGHCYLWRPDILWLNAGSDALIALSYFSIPVSLIYFVKKRKDLAFNWIFLMFAMFIVACGATHVFEIWSIWHPQYGMQGILKLATGLISIATAIALWPLMPRALKLPSPAQLQGANKKLKEEVVQRRVAQARLAEQNQKLLEAERVKSEFLTNVSHELRTPLTLILAPLDSLLAKQDAFSSEQRAVMVTMQNNAIRLLQMINGLLDFSKFEAGKIELRREPTAILTISKTIVQDFQPSAARKKIKLSLAASERIQALQVAMDRYLYERIVFNLLSNAFKFTPEGGEITVSLDYEESDLILKVTDTGIGIGAANLKNLFQKFRQLDGSAIRRFEGTGLGLALVKEFAELLGGSVSVVSEPRQGSEFTVRLFAEETTETPALYRIPKPVAVVSESTYELDMQRGKKNNDSDLPRVLIAEDNVELAAFIAATLADICQTALAKTGVEAWQKVKDWQPHVVVSDIMMPEMDGLTLCRKIKETPATSLTTVLLLTAMTNRQALVQGFQAGASDYIPKPFHPEELRARLHSELATLKTRQEAKTTILSYNKKLREEVQQRTNQLKELNRLAEAQRKQLNLIINSLPAAVAYIDPEERVVFCNKTYAKWYKKGISELINKNVVAITGLKNYDKVKPYIQKGLQGVSTSIQADIDFRGDLRSVDIQYVPNIAANGEVSGLVVLIFDVTHYKSIQRQLSVAKEEAEAASRAKTAFLANMSHEIRTPLGAVVGFSELVANSDTTPSDKQDYVATIKRNSELLSSIINDILDLSKVEVGKLNIEKTNIKLWDVVADVTSLLNLKAAEKGIRLSVMMDGAIPEAIHTDPVRLKQILLNIVGNAIKFTEQGSVDITIQQFVDNNVKLRFVVKDTGAGISKEHQKTLFTPFNQGDAELTRKHGGTGLGLALSKRLAQLLGGDIDLTQSELGQGSTFTISLDVGSVRQVLFENQPRPLNQTLAAPESNRKLQLVDSHAELKGKRILLVEDSLDNQALVKVYLRQGGAEVETANNGQEALWRLSKQPGFDIVLMDLQMPVKDGYETTAELRKRGFKIPIVALTAHALHDEISRCLRSGFDAHVSKPIKKHELTNAIKRFIKD